MTRRRRGRTGLESLWGLAALEPRGERVEAFRYMARVEGYSADEIESFLDEPAYREEEDE